jgi:hypothetical protein
MGRWLDTQQSYIQHYSDERYTVQYLLLYVISVCAILQDWKVILFNRKREEAADRSKKEGKPEQPELPVEPAAPAEATVQQQLLFWLLVSTAQYRFCVLIHREALLLVLSKCCTASCLLLLHLSTLRGVLVLCMSAEESCWL